MLPKFGSVNMLLRTTGWRMKNGPSWSQVRFYFGDFISLRLTCLVGKPPVWMPPIATSRLNEDSGDYYRDQNAARFPSHPLEPAVRAVHDSDPEFATNSIDIFGCASTLENLLRFARGIDKSFRTLVDVVGNTVFLTRRENSPTELIPDVRGFGHTFPEAYTSWEGDIKGSQSHQRILRYSFGDIKILVRIKADGYFQDKIGLTQQGKEVEDSHATDSIDQSLASMLHAQAASSPTDASDKPLTVHPRGSRVPTAAVFDLKTRSHRKKDDDTLSEELPRLWVSQIPNFVLAFHDKGLFEDIRIQNVRREVEDWEQTNHHDLARFAALIHKVVSYARSNGGQQLELRRKDSGPLEIRESKVGQSGVLSADLESWWRLGKAAEGEGSDDDLLETKTGHLSDDDPLYDSDDSEKDFTACSAEDCGYCGHCSY